MERRSLLCRPYKRPNLTKPIRKTIVKVATEDQHIIFFCFSWKHFFKLTDLTTLGDIGTWVSIASLN